MYHPQQPVHQPQFRATGRRSSSAPSSQQPQQSEACWTGNHSHTSAPLAHRPAPVSTRKMQQQQQQQQQIRAHTPYSRGNSPHPPTQIHKPPTLHQPAALVSPSAQQQQHNNTNTTQAPSPTSSAPTVFCPRTPQMVTSNNHAAVTPLGEQVDTIAAIKAIQSANAITSKPPRPYTEYTMFYQLEREYILHRLLKDNKKTDGGDDGNKDKKEEDTSTPPVALFANDPLMPAKFRSLPLRADWYISGKSKKPTKRKHRKSHGKIGFLELTRMIAARWAKVDDETRKYCKMMAAMELVKYKEDMESYNKYKDQLSAIGQIPEDMKERMIKKKISQQKKVASNRAKGKKDTPGVTNKKKRNATGPPPLPPIMQADHVGSSMTMMTRGSSASVAMPSLAPIKLEQPLIHTAPLMHNGASNLDNDMEQFISTLVQSPNRPTTSKTIITPDRSSPRIKKRRMLFRDKSTGSTTAAALANIDEMTVPLKGDGTSDDHLIPLTFSGIDENEIAREFSDHVHRPRQGHITGSPVGTSMKKMEPSFDYWDALVGV